ncbi:lipopolysaccharide 1,6-galactosyltransferase [Levilactobacillus koreensis JCM 16448]|uniref:Uncharacterized protein n=1 Tax=Levilactobacillus koreensis TaxID=637971 RepID=A0AAC8ZH42_9LACO|nr:glycosyltransferase [Levilactobacillus koreensis]AKP65340.1 hypothetical protein ABN16_10220 [Levilactobacillus koreensis]KRK86073.1 lipopolysaccharide 1,6-galactosyltransferase [Levilactobacillus koreensis JCM 16448]
MKILIVTPGLSGKGGTERVVTDLVNDDISNTYSLFVYDIENNGEWLNQVQISESRKSFNNGELKIKKIFNLYRFFIKSNPDVLLILGTKQLSFFSALKKLFRLKVRLIFWPHFSINNETSFQKKEISKSDFYFAISSGIKKQLVAHGISPRKIFTVFNPVKKQVEVVKVPSGNITKFVMLSRVQYQGQKNLREIFLACANLKGNWKLEIYGDTTVDNGNELLKCKKLCNELGIQDNVVFQGWVKEPWRRIMRANCLVLCSNYEGFPMALCESISRGVPVISSNCPTGTDDIVKEGKNGYLYKLGSISDLTNKMQLFIDKVTYFDVDEVKRSLNVFYSEAYISRIDRILRNIGD